MFGAESNWIFCCSCCCCLYIGTFVVNVRHFDQIVIGYRGLYIATETDSCMCRIIMLKYIYIHWKMVERNEQAAQLNGITVGSSSDSLVIEITNKRFKQKHWVFWCYFTACDNYVVYQSHGFRLNWSFRPFHLFYMMLAISFTVSYAMWCVHFSTQKARKI